MEAAERARSSGATNGTRAEADAAVNAPETDANVAAGAQTICHPGQLVALQPHMLPSRIAFTLCRAATLARGLHVAVMLVLSMTVADLHNMCAMNDTFVAGQ